MTRNTRIGFLVAAAVVAVVAIVLIGFGGNDTDEKSDPIATQPESTATQSQAQPKGGAKAPDATTTPTPAPTAQVIEVKDNAPVGGVQTIEFNKGDEVNYVVKTDAAVEIHTHGYDIAEDAAPGKPAKFSFEADKDGIYEVEVEDTGTQIAKLRIDP